MARVDADNWLNHENKNALIDMWQAKPVVIIIIWLLKLKKSLSNRFVVDRVLVNSSKLNINWSNWFYDL